MANNKWNMIWELKMWEKRRFFFLRAFLCRKWLKTHIFKRVNNVEWIIKWWFFTSFINLYFIYYNTNFFFFFELLPCSWRTEVFSMRILIFEAYFVSRRLWNAYFFDNFQVKRLIIGDCRLAWRWNISIFKHFKHYC